MTSAYPAPMTLADAIWPARSQADWRRMLIFAVLGTALLAVCAKIQVPLKPVPVTMQTFAVLLIGAAYGWRLGVATLLLYAAEGFVGLPVFAGATAGPAYFAGPTAGFLLGFVLAVAVVGGLAGKGWDRNPATQAAALVIGNLVLYVPGLLWLQTFTGWGRLWQAGALPFLFGDALKLALAAVLLPLAWDIIQRARGDT